MTKVYERNYLEEAEVRSKGILLVLGEAKFQDLYPSPPSTPSCQSEMCTRMVNRSYLHTLSIVLPYFSTLFLKLVCFLLWVCCAPFVRRWHCDRRFQVPLKPCIKASVICMLQWSTFRRKTVSHFCRSKPIWVVPNAVTACVISDLDLVVVYFDL